MKRIGIFGTSGMARETGDIACELGYSPVYIARDRGELDAWHSPGDIILENETGRYRDMTYAIGIGDNDIRQRVARRFFDKIKFSNLIHPTATFGQGQRQVVEIQQGVIVCAGVRFTNNIRIGDFGIINLNSTISHDVVIEDFVYLAPGVHVAGNVRIGSRCWVGTGAAINQGTNDAKLHIGAGTVIGSGAVVTQSCAPDAIYVGIPAKRIR